MFSEIGTVALVQATSPFLQRNYIKEAVALMNTYNLDSVFSVTRQWKFRWSSVSENEMKTGRWAKPENFDPSNRPRRQDWKGELVENGMFYFARRQIVLDGLLQGKRYNWNSFHWFGLLIFRMCFRSYYVEIPHKHSLDIDTVDDLRVANFIMQQAGSEKIETIQNRSETEEL